MTRVVVFDHGLGNLRSAVRALMAAGADVELTNDPRRGREADGLVVPGVGAFAAVMAGLRKAGGETLVRERVAEQAPVLGICVGMQVLFESGTEHGVHCEGLGLVPGSVERLRADIVPHMGWTTVSPPADSRLFAGIEHEYFYFVHSYAAPLPAASDEAAGFTAARHGHEFCAALELGALSATQFHPEKSADAGIALLRNWIAGL